MPNKPQDPPAGYYSLHMAPAFSRPTSSPPPKRKEVTDPLELMKERWVDAVERCGMLRKSNESLQKEIRELKLRLGKHECPSCGDLDREENRYIHDVTGDPVCFTCGNNWE